MDLFSAAHSLTHDLFKAYYDARKNKRNTHNALQFEMAFESNVMQLSKEIAECTYQLSPCICFIVNRPVKREIFAAHFRDRVVHHYVINKLNAVFENQFIYDSYSCRKGKGTHFGIERLKRFMRSCSDNYTKEAYVLKLDIQGFFMNINKKLLCQRVCKIISDKYKGEDKQVLMYLVETIILNDPTKNCIVKGSKEDWDGLPGNKSLFKTPDDCGMPIGNLTSQVFANIYMNDFDHYVKEKLKCRYYGRYVDDFFIVHRDKEYLKSLIPKLRDYLQQQSGLVLHPKKIYLQPVTNGVSYLGAIVKPYRTYMGKRAKGNSFSAVQAYKKEDLSVYENARHLVMTMNSYFGYSVHHKSYAIRQKILDNMPMAWMQYPFTMNNISRKEEEKREKHYRKQLMKNARVGAIRQSENAE
jgi:RNA-directed DNA polymerase